MKHLILGLFTLVMIACAPGIIRPRLEDATSPPTTSQSPDADNPNPPSQAVKLIFIHHSTGGNWLADPNEDQAYGGLGRALMNNNYFVSATNYGWGPTWPDQGQPIGSFTDIIHWPVWFTGQYSSAILAALYAENNQNICNPSSPSDDCFGNWSRLSTNPSGENEIIMFKSCFPNSDLYGNPNDPPLAEPDDSYTVANAKAVYNKILTYFATRQDKLFIVITAPPLMQSETAPERAANARAFNNWLVNDWLDGYPYHNVAVFDYYNVLTSNGGNANTNDLGAETGNHHRWWNGAVQHIQTVNNNYAAYPSGDSHPTTAGHQKAAAEFVQLLNVFYHRWKGGVTPTPSLTLVAPNGGENWAIGSQHQIQWTSANLNGNVRLDYSTDHWNTTHNIIASTVNTGSYNWTVPNAPSTDARVRVSSVLTATISDTSNAPFTISQAIAMDKFVYLPLVLKSFTSQQPTCAHPLTGVTITGPTSGGLSLQSPIPNPQSPIPNPQSLIPNPQSPIPNSPSPASILAAQPTNLAATHRGGQTFLTWTENTAVSGESYHVYRHTAPITADNITQTTRLTQKWGPLPEGSSTFYTELDWEPAGSTESYTRTTHYIIADLGAPLADTTGLFVWTSKQAGNYYYAVTTVEAGGSENLADFSGNTIGPVAETATDPEPVLIWQSANGNARVYTQFMDWETYNPTFERPTAEGGLVYAYNYFVGIPTAELCGGSLPAALPVILHIEGYGSRYEVTDGAPYFCALEIRGDDPRQSWYYGFSASYDYRTGDPTSTPPSSGPIVNYTEERLLRSVYDTLRDPDYAAYHLDPQRVYVYGHSMGGSGALALAMRYPNVFAASYSSEPMTNYRTAGDGGGDDWRTDTVPKWGTLAANLPISNVGRYAGHLAAYNGTGVWDWQNHQANLVSRAGDEMAYISLAHGTLDTVIEWPTQGKPAYAPFYQGRRAFSGATAAAGHDWIGFNGMGPNVTADLGAPFYNFGMVRNESIPGLSNASGSSAAPPADNISATYNLNLEWSASWDNWDGAPIDTAGQWRISLRTTDDSNQTVDVTPRRLQHFNVTPGANYAWENRRVSDDGLVASGTVAAAANGLVTVQNFAVTPGGNRLVLQPAGGPVQPTLTLVSPNGGEVWQAGSQHSIQWTHTGSIANVSLAYSTDNFATSHTIIASTANTGSYNWTIPNNPATTARVRVSSVVTPSIRDDSNANFTIQAGGGPSTYVFTATITPANATTPVTYQWSPNPYSGQGTAIASYQWSTPGTYVITVTATNCGGPVVDTHTITIGAPPSTTIRPMPDTTNGIHVFNDQLANSMSEVQFQFAATHYAGTQKMTRADADHLRTYNPNFVILHYRLGLGLGYRGIESGCQPTGEWLAIIEGDDWVQEWPGDGNVSENWFYHWPEAGATRVLNCDWGWYLMNLDNSSWRTYWSGEVLRQLQANADDGLFADSFSVPNYLGYDHYSPNLPELDNAFESQWAARLENFMTFVQQGSLATYYFIPNAGQWVTSRETTDYSIADGVMIEGFGGWGYANYFELSDWQLQMNRILGLVNQDKIILAQQYLAANRQRMRDILPTAHA